MGAIDQAFQRFFESTRLTEGMRQQVSERLAALQGVLRARWKTPEVLPIGSYARGTIVPPVKDADVLFVLRQQRQGEGAVAVLQEVREALAAAYGKDVRVQRHSVRVAFQDFAIDVVPAFGAAGGYTIPELVEPGDLSHDGKWIATDPRAHEERLRKANERWNGGATRLIVTLKSMNERHTTRLKSFHLEGLVLDRLEKATMGTGTFAAELPGWLDGIAEDVARSGEAYLTEVTRREIAARQRNDAGTMREALRLDDVALARKVVPGLV